MLNDEEGSEWRSVRGSLFQTDGPIQENDLSANSFVLTRGVMKLHRVSGAECNFQAGMCGCIRSDRY